MFAQQVKYCMLPSTEPPTTDDKSFTLPMTVLPSPGSPTSPDHKTKRQSDPTPFGFKDAGPPPLHLSRARWFSTSSLLQTKWRGWNKASLSLDASEEHDGYSSAEEPLNSDPEDENGKKLCAGKYTVIADYEKGNAQELSVKNGDIVQLVKEGDDGQWFVRNLSTSKEGWIAAANLITLIGKSKSCQSLTSSEGSGSGNLSTSSSCSETYTSFSDIKP
ncbi:guanine nucleotide exchange factor DBS-like isoform X1 [Seriola lalandi dorsalis]|uniref:guanine nucleotide exchange factor DBS-like isoform X1 n=1 Tax=Seriola lalandi dorsalis TaxID=1841481 RepID=UPI000C6F72E2|nr:guanine nucleotide exchange factor DBS-like isoform X1 [Seriola lalandi dorsalis]